MAKVDPKDRPADGDSAGRDDEENLRRLRKEYLPGKSTGGGEMATAGLELGMIFAVLALGGWWLDRRADTSPLFLLLGCFVAIVGGLYRLIKRSSIKK